MVDVGVAFDDREHLIVEVALLDRGRAAGAACVVGVPAHLEAGVSRGLQQQCEVLAPVAGDHGVGARRLDLRNVRREVGDLQQRVLFVADDLDVRTLFFQHRTRRGAHGFAERIILIDEVQLLDGGNALHVVGEGFHLDVGIRVPAEVRKAALVVGEDGVDRGVVEVEHFLAGVAFVVLGDEVTQRAGHGRAVALGEVTHAGVDGLLGLDQAFLRVGLVVERNDFDLLAENAALGVQFIGQILKGLEADFADAGAAARERVDIADFHGVLRHRRSAQHGQCERRSHHQFTHSHLPKFSLRTACLSGRTRS